MIDIARCGNMSNHAATENSYTTGNDYHAVRK